MFSSRLAAIRVILFDVGNTLTYVDLALVAGVLEATDVRTTPGRLSNAEETARAAMYRHHDANPNGNDRDRWTVYLGSMLAELGVRDPERIERIRAALALAHERTHLWCRVLSGTASTLDALHERGYRLGAVSNADGRVDELLRDVRLDDKFDVIVDSHRVGVEKPDPRIFGIALERLGASSAETMYVGDFYSVDVLGARSAGVFPVLFDPLETSEVNDCPVITTLGDLQELLPARAAGEISE